jgi:hypothetical protein
VADVARNAFDWGNPSSGSLQEAGIVSSEMTRPSVLFRPALPIDGFQWCALDGENLQDGVAGFRDTPALAVADFDKAWLTAKARA